jgi:hypothetical protein
VLVKSIEINISVFTNLAQDHDVVNVLMCGGEKIVVVRKLWW